MCFCNEAFYGLLYINHFYSGPALFLGVTPMHLLLVPFGAVALVKSAISAVHLVTASQEVAQYDQALRAKQQ